MPDLRAQKGANDFLVLPAGKSVEWAVSVMARPVAPGKYTVKTEFAPTPDETYKVRQELTVTYEDIPPELIAHKVVMPLPFNPNHPGRRGDVDEIQLMNVKTAKGFHLFFKLVKQKGTSIYVERLFPLVEDTRLMAVSKFFDRPEFTQQIWVVYNKGTDLFLAQLDAVTGQVLENSPIHGKQQGEQSKNSK
jgi:hypothetical protein